MHPSLPERARSLHRWGAVAVLVLVATGLGGCNPPSDPEAAAAGAAASAASVPARFAPVRSIGETTEAERDSALAILGSMQRAAFDSAFVRLPAYAFRRTTRTEQIDPASGAVTSRRERTVRYEAGEPQGAVVAASDSGAAFDEGMLDELVPGTDATARPENLATSAFPDDPAYRSKRTQEAFRYRARRSTYAGRPAWTVTVQARRDGQGRDQSVRHAELTLLRDTRTLVRASTIRSENVLLFREESRLEVALQPGPSGTWVPDRTRFHARIDIPFREVLELRTTSTYAVSGR